MRDRLVDWAGLCARCALCCLRLGGWGERGEFGEYGFDTGKNWEL